MQTILQTLKIVFLALGISLGVSFAYAAWVAPTQAPPDGNTPAPLNVSNDGQIKDGGLLLGNLVGTLNGLIVRYGKVGIGTTDPVAKLDVAGDIKIGNENTACTSTNVGSVRYSTATKKIELCNGLAWRGVEQEEPIGFVKSSDLPLAEGDSVTVHEFGGGYVWVGISNSTGNKIIKLDSEGKLVETIKYLSTESAPSAMTYDGSAMWVLNEDSSVKKISGTAQSNYPKAGGSGQGGRMVFDGANMWVVSYIQNNDTSIKRYGDFKINKYSSSGVKAVYSDARFGNFGGWVLHGNLFFDGTNMWTIAEPYASAGTSYLIKIDPNGNITWPATLVSQPRIAALYGGYLFVKAENPGVEPHLTRFSIPTLTQTTYPYTTHGSQPGVGSFDGRYMWSYGTRSGGYVLKRMDTTLPGFQYNYYTFTSDDKSLVDMNAFFPVFDVAFCKFGGDSYLVCLNGKKTKLVKIRIR